MAIYRFDVANKAGTAHFVSGCPAVLGSELREPAAGAVCHKVEGDHYFSRQHLRLDVLPGGRLKLVNLSKRGPITLHDGAVLAPGESRDVALPARVVAGETRIDIDAVESDEPIGATLVPVEGDEEDMAEPDQAPDAAILVKWLDRVVALLRKASASSDEFGREAAKAVVDLIGLDLGLVLARQGEGWEVVARYPEGDEAAGVPGPSRAILDEVLRTGRAFYEIGRVARPSASLRELGAVVAAPWIGPRDGEVAGVVYGARSLATGAGLTAISPIEARLVLVLASAVSAGRARQVWQERFTQFTAPELARHLDQNPKALDIGRRVVTLLASDVRNSSALAGRMGERYFDLSRDLMGRLTLRIAEAGGVVVDYAGDGILAMWNAPEPLEDHADRACRAALAMVAELAELNAIWADELGGPLAVGIGVHTGEALVGNAGSRWKVKYGPVGNVVNTASRVEGATKHLGVPIVISEATRESLQGRLPTRRLCRARLVGLSDPIVLHELYAGTPDEEWEAHRTSYEAALKQFEVGAFPQAGRRLQHHLGQWADDGARPDPPALALLGRVVTCLQASPTSSFAPEWDFGSK